MEDSEGNAVEVIIEDNGVLISKPKRGKIVFVAYYYYEDEVYKAPFDRDQPVTALGKNSTVRPTLRRIGRG